MNKKVKSVFLFSGFSMLSIGILNVLAEASKQIKDFLTLSKVIGPYSGKILFGILLGLLISQLYFHLAKESKFDIKNWAVFLFVMLMLSCLLVFTPFIHLILGK